MTKQHFENIEAWYAEAKRRFGDDPMAWRFVCPVCGHVASTADYKAAGAPPGAVAISCIGRYLPSRSPAFDGKKVKQGPCNYTGLGLFRLNPVSIGGEDRQAFAFDEPAAEGERASGSEESPLPG